MNKTKEIMKQQRVCVMVPTYNNAGTVVDVVKGILQLTDDLIVVTTLRTAERVMRCLPASRRPWPWTMITPLPLMPMDSTCLRISLFS